MKRFLVALLALAIGAGTAHATGRFVNNQVSSGAGTIGAPFKWIRQATAVVSAGDTIYIRGSASGVTYTDTLSIGTNGSAGSPIVMRSYPGEIVLLRSSSTATISLTKSQWVFKDLIFDHGASGTSLIRAITIDGTHSAPASNITFSGCEIRNGGYDGVYIVDARDIVFDGCNIHDFIYAGNDAHGIKIETVSDSSISRPFNVMVKNSTLSRCSGDGCQVFGVTGYLISGYATGIDFVNNVFTEGNPSRSENALDFKACDSCLVYGNTMSGYKNLQAITIQKGTRNVTIAYNVISSSWSGIDCHEEGGSSFIQTGHRIYGNLIYNVGNASANREALKFDGVDATKVWNNTLVGGQYAAVAVRVSATLAGQGLTNSVFKNNLSYNWPGASNGSSSSMGGTVVGYNGWFGANLSSGTFTTSTDQTGSGDPGFVNAAGADYRPAYSPTSKIIDKGTDSLLVWAFNGLTPDLGYSEAVTTVASYYVSPYGSDLYDGTTAAKAWKTISKANATLPAPSIANVIVYVAPTPGQAYADVPNPANAATGGYRYYFYGSPGDASQTKIQVAGGYARLNKPYVNLVGFHFPGTLIISSTATFDSIVSCRAGGIAHHGDYSVVSGSTIYLGNLAIGRGAGYGDNGAIAGGAGQKIAGAVFRNSSVVAANSDTVVGIGYYASGQKTEWVDSLLFRDNFVVSSPTGPHTRVVGAQHTTRSNFIGNKYFIYSGLDGDGDNVNFWAHSDSSANNRWARDTLLSTGGVEVAMWSASPLRGRNRTLDSCYYQASDGIVMNDRLLNDAITHTIVVSDRAAIKMRSSVSTGNTFDHDDFIGRPPLTAGTPGGIVDFRDATWDGDGGGDDLIFTNNIIYGGNNNTVADCQDLPGNGVYWGQSLLPVDKTIGPAHCVSSNYNLYAWYGQEAVNGDRSIGWGTYVCSRPGATSSAWKDSCESYYGPALADSNSVYGSPRFYGRPDTVHVVRADPGTAGTEGYALGYRSAGTLAGSALSDIGAVGASGSPVPAVVATSQIVLPQACDIPDSATVSVYNAGSAELVIYSATMTGDERTLAAWSVLPTTATIAPGMSQVFKLYNAGQQEAFSSAVLVLSTNDPTHLTVQVEVICSSPH